MQYYVGPSSNEILLAAAPTSTISHAIVRRLQSPMAHISMDCHHLWQIHNMWAQVPIKYPLCLVAHMSIDDILIDNQLIYH